MSERAIWKTHLCGMLSVLVFFGGMVRAAEVQLPEHNCAVTPPEGWQKNTATTQKGQIIGFREPGKASLLVILLDTEHKPDGPVDETFVKQYEGGIEKGGGGKRESGDFIQVGSLKAYERFGDLNGKNGTLSSMTLCVPISDRVYQVMAVVSEGKIKDRPEIRKAVESFRFLQAPAPPPEKSAAEKIGELVGSGLGVGLVVALVFLLANKKNRKRDTTPLPPPGPPPL